MYFAQDGGDLSREDWLSPWPRSKRGNEWVRAFGLTYTLQDTATKLEGGLCVPSTKLTVVGPGGVRLDRTYHYALDSDDMKELLWPEERERPYTIEELQQGEGT